MDCLLPSYSVFDSVVVSSKQFQESWLLGFPPSAGALKLSARRLTLIPN